MVDSDQNKGYLGLREKEYTHQTVNHSVEAVVNGLAHTTTAFRVFWGLLKRGHCGTYHQMRAKHLPRYINEHATADQMASVAKGFISKRLRQRELVT